jgi:predicted phage-related endonuclease
MQDWHHILNILEITIMKTATMEAKSNANALEAKREKLQELHAQQRKLSELQSELDVIESKIKNDEKLSEEDLKYIGKLGWLSAAAVTIASIAASV